MQISGDGPVEINLIPGREYKWCTCGLSKEQPFCDNRSHIGTKHSPKQFKVSVERKAWVCMCKHTERAPYCDGSHQIKK
jgi:CDGSH-type Zn-finger protein